MNEFLDSSDMYCFELLMNVDCKIRFRISARLVPRCGVARNVMAEIALMIAWYLGSFWPCMYAFCMSVSRKAMTIYHGLTHLFDYKSTHAVDHKYQRHLGPILVTSQLILISHSYIPHIQIVLLFIFGVFQVEKQLFSKIQYRAANVAGFAKIGIVSEGKDSGKTDVRLEGEKCQRPEKLWTFVLRPCMLTCAPKAVHKYDVHLVAIVRSVNDTQSK